MTPDELWWPSVDELIDALKSTIESFLENDADLIRLDANERSLTHRFAVQLEREFPGWHIDCEYNRDHHLPKRLKLHVERDVSTDDTDARTVYPDIIVHRRDTHYNLLVIEAKKAHAELKPPYDQEKLAAYCDQLGYRYGVSLLFWTEANADERALVSFDLERSK